jgi:hypothetical protein
VHDRETLLKQRGPAALVLLLLSFFLVPSLSAHSPSNASAAVSATKAVKATPVASSLHEGRHDAAGPLDVPTLSSGFPGLTHVPWTAYFSSQADAARAVVTSVHHQARAPPSL